MAKVADTVLPVSQSEPHSLRPGHSSAPEKQPRTSGTLITNTTRTRVRRYEKLRSACDWLFTDSWTLEYASLALAIGSLASIAGVLGYYQNRATVDGPHLLTLNAVISFLGTILKGAMMLSVGSCLSQLKWVLYTQNKDRLSIFEVFDDASRGPMGAARLLLLRCRHLASTGCIVTLMALASDAFIQQSVSYPSRSAETSHAATLPYAQSYSDRSGTSSGDETITQIQLSPTMEAAIYDGALSTNVSHSSSSISPQCPTGNCTFPEFASLAVCSRCTIASCQVNTSVATDTTTDYNIVANLSNGLALNLFNGNLNASATLPSLGLLPESDTIFVDASFLRYIALEQPQCNGYECTLEFCLKVYHSEVKQGLLAEVVKEQLHFSPPRRPPDQPPEGFTFILPSNYSVPKGGSRNFTTDFFTFHDLETFWSTTLNGTNSEESRNLVNMISSSLAKEAQPDIPQMMDRMATSMTNNIRQNDLLTGTKYRTLLGTTYTTETFTQPHWLWLLYPLVMILLAILFCGLTIWKTKTLGMPSWKSSVLAIMLHGIQEGEEDLLDCTRDGGCAGKEPVSRLEEWAEDVDVRLRHRGNTGFGYGLVRAERAFGH